MKKTLIALLALGGVACGVEYGTPTIDSGSYTLSMDNWTTGDSTLYNYLYGVFIEGGTLTFNLDINYSGTNCGHYQSLLHVGQLDTGFSIFANGGPNLIVSPKHNTAGKYELPTAMSAGQHSVAITLTGNAENQEASVSYSMDNGTKSGSLDEALKWSDMAWNTANGEAYKYSINKVAPGYSDNYQDKTDADTLIRPANTTTLSAGSATYLVGTGPVIVSVPEPTTATLSLLALAGLAARRRRK